MSAADKTSSNVSTGHTDANRLDRDASAPLYRQMSDSLRERVLAGDWDQASAFPTEVELSRDWDVSAYTVRQALGLLVDEGLLIRERGRGTFVRPANERPLARQDDSLIKHKRIGLVMPWDQGSFFSSMFMSVEQAAHQAGYRLMLVNNWNDADVELERIRETVRHGVDGLIWMCSADGPKPTALRYAQEGVPAIVFVDRAPTELADQLSLVTADNRGGMRAVVQYLLDTGRRRIAMASAQRQFSSTKDREEGYLAAMRGAGIDVPNGWIFGSRSIGLEAGAVLAEKILNSKESFDAICCSSDSVAAGIMKRLTKAGLKIPQDIAVTGFDDDPICSVVSPTLTTARIDLPAVAQEATQLLVGKLDRLRNRQPVSVAKLVVPVEIVVRESA